MARDWDGYILAVKEWESRHYGTLTDEQSDIARWFWFDANIKFAELVKKETRNLIAAKLERRIEQIQDDMLRLKEYGCDVPNIRLDEAIKCLGIVKGESE